MEKKKEPKNPLDDVERQPPMNIFLKKKERRKNDRNISHFFKIDNGLEIDEMKRKEK